MSKKITFTLPSLPSKRSMNVAAEKTKRTTKRIGRFAKAITSPLTKKVKEAWDKTA